MDSTLLTQLLYCLGGDLGGFGGDEDEQQFEIVDNGNKNEEDDYFD